MTTFAYTAIGKDGAKTSGKLSAESRASAIAQVVKGGYHPLSISEEAAKGGAARTANGASPAVAAKPGRVPQKAVEAFTRELANLLSGGVSLSRALNLLRREASGDAAKQLWGSVHDSVVGGESLGDAMAKWPKAFSSVYVAMVRAGETGGFLDVVLGQIADFRAREQDLKGKVKTAMIYPAVLATLAVGVLIFLLTFFIPTFSKMFADLGGSLPLLTQFIIALSKSVTQYGLFVLVAVIICTAMAWRSLSTDEGRRRLERGLLATPVLGKVIAHFALVRFCRMLGTLVGAGVPLVAALRVAREAVGNQTLSDTVQHAVDEVQRGTPLSRSLSDGTKLFPAAVIETLAVAEETGRLDKELVRIAAAFESDLDRQLRTLVAILEPVLLFVMAAIIGTVVIGMLLPIFNLQDLIK